MNQIFNFNGNEITFSKGKDVMVNATEMAKPFGKRTNDWLSTKQSFELINSLSVKTGIPATGLVVVNQGGNNQGTWMHEDVALLFAQWLSPKLYLWCNDRIKELIKHGATAINPEDLLDPDYIIQLAMALKEERSKNLLLEACNKDNVMKIESMKPKEIFADSVAASKDSILVSDLAKVLSQNGIKTGQNRLFTWMRDNGYLLSKGAYYNRPSQRAIEMGLFEVNERTISSPNGTSIISFTTKVTGKGQQYFINKFPTAKEFQQ